MSMPYMLIVALDIRSTIRTIISAKSSNALIMRYPLPATRQRQLSL